MPHSGSCGMFSTKVISILIRMWYVKIHLIYFLITANQTELDL